MTHGCEGGNSQRTNTEHVSISPEPYQALNETTCRQRMPTGQF